ncbi:MAG: glycosyltransferase family 4 protein [Terriglobales bacterium]
MYASHLIRELRAAPNLDLEVFNGSNIANGHTGFFARAIRSAANRYWSHSSFPRLLREQPIDVLHGPAFVVPVSAPCPSVVTIHDLTFILFPEHFPSRWRRYVASRMPSILRAVSAVICISEYTKQDLLRFYNVTPNKVHVVYNGMDHSRIHPAARLDPAWAATMGLREGYVLHVGTLVARKNIPTLLGAVAHLRSKGKWRNRQVVLAGSETQSFPGCAEVHETIRNFSLQEIVLLVGHVPDEQVPGLYAQASLLVMPTLYEGFGLPILESMAAGTPVVASNNSSIPEVAGNAAILVPTLDVRAMADAIETVLGNPSIAKELREKGLIQAAKFSWQRMAAETVEIYRRVAKS